MMHQIFKIAAVMALVTQVFGLSETVPSTTSIATVASSSMASKPPATQFTDDQRKLLLEKYSPMVGKIETSVYDGPQIDGKAERWNGSGLYIGNGLILTNRHVAGEMMELTTYKVEIFDKTLLAKFHWAHMYKDFAVLKILDEDMSKIPTNLPKIEFSREFLKMHTPVALYGFSESRKNLHTGIVADYDIDKLSPLHFRIVQANLGALGGSSGSPVWQHDAETNTWKVCGINYAGTFFGSSGLFVPCEEFLDDLERVRQGDFPETWVLPVPLTRNKISDLQSKKLVTAEQQMMFDTSFSDTQLDRSILMILRPSKTMPSTKHLDALNLRPQDILWRVFNPETEAYEMIGASTAKIFQIMQKNAGALKLEVIRGRRIISVDLQGVKAEKYRITSYIKWCNRTFIDMPFSLFVSGKCILEKGENQGMKHPICGANLGPSVLREILPGDTLVSVNGQDVTSLDHLWEDIIPSVLNNPSYIHVGYQSKGESDVFTREHFNPATMNADRYTFNLVTREWESESLLYNPRHNKQVRFDGNIVRISMCKLDAVPSGAEGKKPMPVVISAESKELLSSVSHVLEGD